FFVFVLRYRTCCADPRTFSVFFFFFQAEDGIRDRNVTGVQTCALPICAACHRCRSWPRRPSHGSCTGLQSLDLAGSVFRCPKWRSEERRVGKECRARWGPDDYKKKGGSEREGGEECRAEMEMECVCAC